MSDQSRRVLDLLSQGKVSVDEAEKLLSAVSASPAEPEPNDKPADGKETPRHLRIVVVKAPQQGRPEKNVNIRIPIALMRGGMRLGAMIHGLAGEEMTERLRERGIDFDFSKLDEAKIETILKECGEMTVDMDEGKTQVRIRCE